MSSRAARKQGAAKSFEMSFEEAAEQAFERLYREGAVGPERILRTAEAILDGLQRCPDTAKERLLEISKALVLSAGRHHRNLIEAGRALLDRADHIGQRYHIEPEIALDRILLGLAEGSCQVGPIVYSRLLEIAVEYRDDAETWLRRHRRASVELTFDEHPIIIPIIDDLRLTTPEMSPTRSASKTCSRSALTTPTSWEAVLVVEEDATPVPYSKPTSSKGWSKTPESRSLFRRFSDVLGQVFGRYSKRVIGRPDLITTPEQNS